jgi:uncharacterized membrane protein YkgB
MTHNQTNHIISITIFISFLLLGLSFLLGANLHSISNTFGFYFITEWLDPRLLGILTGITFIVAGVFVVIARYSMVCDDMLLNIMFFIAIIPLVTLLSEMRWMLDLGGFPIIGSGQGIIKYAALIPLAIYLVRYNILSLYQHAALNFIPIALVLYWIGGMKFFEFEANAIVSLVETSPLMSWLYAVFSVQGASSLIGVYDVLFASLLGITIWLKMPRFGLFAILGVGTVFVMTQSFLFTANNVFNTDTIIGSLGMFLIKDLWFFGNLAVIAHFITNLDNAPESS